MRAVIERDAAFEALRPLARPTLDAFVRASKLEARLQKAAGEENRKRFDAPILGVRDGVDFWSSFATFLSEDYESVPALTAVTTHRLKRLWLLDDRIALQLKSDVFAVDAEQPMIPGIEEAGPGQPAIVALTWQHDRGGRHDPAFVHLTADGIAWSILVKDLLDEAAPAIRPAVPRARVASRRDTERETGGHRAGEKHDALKRDAQKQ
jgi:hypothetical protein